LIFIGPFLFFDCFIVGHHEVVPIGDSPESAVGQIVARDRKKPEAGFVQNLMVLDRRMNDLVNEAAEHAAAKFCPKEAAMTTATEARSDHAANSSAVGGHASSVTCCQQAAKSFEVAREKARGLTEVALEFVRQHPVRSLIGAFEAGMIIGLLRGRRR
jgi:ElaB/YqjD/DUF883 family membrane-anchored ribosome-binding protein